MTQTNQSSFPRYPGYVSVLERVPIEERNLDAPKAARLEISRAGHAVLATVALVALLAAPVVLPPTAALVGILVGEVSRAPWAEIVPAHPIGVGEGRR